MPRLALLLLLAACAPAPRGTEIGRVTEAGRAYPILQTDQGWQVRAGDQLVQCRADTEEDCYWSLRHHQATIRRLDNIETPMRG
jgi:hypothetical protein